MSVKAMRLSHYQKKKAFKALCERDGDHCQECGEQHRIRWIRCGQYGSQFGGVDTWEYGQTGVIGCSILEVEHRVPLHLGGSNDLGNLWLLCFNCHRAKTSSEQSARLKRLFAAHREGISA